MSDLQQDAISYGEHGLAVFRLGPRSKVPLKDSAGFKDATTDPATIAALWKAEPHANIGIAPGRSTLCGGLLILDGDGLKGMEAVRARGLLDLAGYQVLTGKPDSRHLYFVRPPFRVGNRKLAPNVDVRCDDGYGILPRSVHPNGRAYRAIGELNAIPPLPWAVLRELEQLQREKEPETLTGPIPAVPLADLDTRVRAYLTAVGSRDVGDRDNTAFRVAAWLLNDMALDGALAWDYLVKWNSGNRPPLTNRELRAKLKSAAKHGRRARGCGLVRDPFAKCQTSEAWL